MLPVKWRRSFVSSKPLFDIIGFWSCTSQFSRQQAASALQHSHTKLFRNPSIPNVSEHLGMSFRGRGGGGGGFRGRGGGGDRGRPGHSECSCVMACSVWREGRLCPAQGLGCHTKPSQDSCGDLGPGLTEQFTGDRVPRLNNNINAGSRGQSHLRQPGGQHSHPHRNAERVRGLPAGAAGG